MSETERLKGILKDYAAICQASSDEIKMLRERIAELEQQLAGEKSDALPKGT